MDWMPQPKDIDQVGGWKHEHACTLPTSLRLTTPPSYIIIFIVKLIMFPLWLVIIIIFYIFSGYWLQKLIKIFHYCDYVTITQYHRIMIGQQKNNRTLYHQNYGLIEKPVITFLNPDAYQNCLKIFWKIHIFAPRYCFYSPELQICF